MSLFFSRREEFVCCILTRTDNLDVSPPRKFFRRFRVVIKPEDRQLLADFVKNLTNEQRREMLQKVLKTRFKPILKDEEMEKFREQLRADLKSKHCEDNAA
jgi:hypothetical protein